MGPGYTLFFSRSEKSVIYKKSSNYPTFNLHTGLRFISHLLILVYKSFLLSRKHEWTIQGFSFQRCSPPNWFPPKFFYQKLHHSILQQYYKYKHLHRHVQGRAGICIKVRCIIGSWLASGNSAPEMFFTDVQLLCPHGTLNTYLPSSESGVSVIAASWGDPVIRLQGNSWVLNLRWAFPLAGVDRGTWCGLIQRQQGSLGHGFL